MYDIKRKAPKEGSDKVIGSSTSGKGKSDRFAGNKKASTARRVAADVGHMELKADHPPKDNESYTLGSAGKVNLYVKSY